MFGINSGFACTSRLFGCKLGYRSSSSIIYFALWSLLGTVWRKQGHNLRKKMQTSPRKTCIVFHSLYQQYKKWQKKKKHFGKGKESLKKEESEKSLC